MWFAARDVSAVVLVGALCFEHLFEALDSLFEPLDIFSGVVIVVGHWIILAGGRGVCNFKNGNA